MRTFIVALLMQQVLYLGTVQAQIQDNIPYDLLTDEELLLPGADQIIDHTPLFSLIIKTAELSPCLSVSEKWRFLEEISKIPGIAHPFELQTLQGIPLESLSCFIQEITVNISDAIPDQAHSPDKVTIESLFNRSVSESSDTTSPFLLPWHVVLRIRGTGQTRNWGFLTEKDPGEQLWIKNKGPEHISGYLHFRKQWKFVDEIILGNFRLRLGQGLLFNNFYRRGLFLSQSTLPKYSGKQLAPFHSLDENLALTGSAAIIKLSHNLEVLPFCSLRKLDASTAPDTTGYIGNFQTSGRHISTSEINNKDRAGMLTYGVCLTQRLNSGTVSLNVLGRKLDQPLSVPDDLYAHLRQRDQSTLNASLSYDIYISTFNFFGEISLDKHRTPVLVAGSLWSPSSSSYFSLVIRRFSPAMTIHNMQSLSYSSVGNENGIHLGYHQVLSPRMSFTLNLDTRINPWWSFRDAPFRRSDQLSFLLRNFRRKHYELYWKIDWQKRDQGESSDVSHGISEHKVHVRTHFVCHITRDIEWRSRVQFSAFRPAVDHEFYKGWLLYQEVLFQPIGRPFSVAFRISQYASENFESRIYAYESRLGGLFSLPSFSGNGYRFYLNSKYRFDRFLIGLRLEGTKEETWRVGYGCYIKADMTKKEG